MGLNAGATAFVPRAKRIGFTPGGGGSVAASPAAQAHAPPGEESQGVAKQSNKYFKIYIHNF